MKPFQISTKKRPRPSGNKKLSTTGKRSLPLGFVQDLLSQSLLTNSALNTDGDISQCISVSEDPRSDVTLHGKDEEKLVPQNAFAIDPSGLKLILARYNPLDKLYEVRELLGKGFGVVASVSITSGTVVLSEAPLFILLASTPMPVSFSALDSLIVAQGLSPDVKHAISKLANFYPTTTTHPAVGILKTNSLPVTMKDSSGKERRAGGLFEIVCRLNHSCVPNAVANWESQLGERGEMRVTAIRIIEAGEEVTISYGVASEDLKERFGFDCDCEKCVPRPYMPSEGRII